MNRPMNASDPLTALDQFAGIAETHAREEYGLNLGPDSLADVDRILMAEVQRGGPDVRQTLTVSFGAWLGRWCLRRWKARWVGLFEPAAPRILIQGISFSPIDAVRRRLLDPSSPPLPQVLSQIDELIRKQAELRDRAPDANKAAWDALAEDPRFAGGAPPADRDEALASLDEWLRDESIKNRALLCLGAGGGRQGPLHALAGADVTVVDVSERQLDHDRRAGLRTVCASMDKLDALADASFDFVVQPVSTSYVADLDRVHAEVARVLKPGGLYIVQHKQPASLQASAGTPYFIAVPCADGHALPDQPAPHREAGTTEFVHSLESLLGGLCRAGFVIEDFREPPRADASAPAGEAGHRAWHLPPYLKIKARRR
jgi:SAM-dependent methyltransferase